VEHGRPPGIRYSFTLHVESGRLLGHLRDGGPPLDEYERPMPDTDSENGRGLALARVALDDLEYQRADAVCGATGILHR
jgi:serine/threonine-protein kinase RsbW